MMFIPVSENTNFIGFVLVEIKASVFAILELQEVVVQTFLADANFLGGLF